MNFTVRLQPAALEDLDAAYLFAASHAPKAAGKWLERFHQALQTLQHRPDRCPLAPESRRSSRVLREFLYGRRPNVYRAIYTLDGTTVWILRIRRAQRRPFRPEELNDL